SLAAIDQPAEDEPLAIVAAGREFPMARQPIAARRGARLAAGHVARSQERVRITAPYLFLRFEPEQAEMELMDRHDGEDPAGGAAAGVQRNRAIEERYQPALRAAEAFRLQQREEPFAEHLLDALARHAAERVRRFGTCAQLRRQCHSAGDIFRVA